MTLDNEADDIVYETISINLNSEKFETLFSRDTSIHVGADMKPERLAELVVKLITTSCRSKILCHEPFHSQMCYKGWMVLQELEYYCRLQRIKNYKTGVAVNGLT